MAQPLMIKSPAGERCIGPGHKTFVIAEMSGNHIQDFSKAKQLITAVAAAGADAIKLQTYTPDTMTIDCANEYFRVGEADNPDVWQGKTLYELYIKAHTPWEWHAELQKLATENGLIFFSTPFDATAVDFLETLNVPCYKVASYEATDIPLLAKIAATKKPVIMSVGFATAAEIVESVATLRANGCTELALLHCLTSYAAVPDGSTANLHTIQDIATKFDVVAGFSDNNGGIELPFLATLAGAQIVEKHVIMSRSDGGPDADFSITPDELSAMIIKIRQAEVALGRVHYGTQNSAEEYNKRFRRSIFAVADIAAGETLTANNIRVIRPAFGLEPKHLAAVLGRRAKGPIARGTPLSWDLLST